MTMRSDSSGTPTNSHEVGSRPARAFTLIEICFVIAIIGVLIALLLPAIQSSREAARRMQCENNLLQLGTALGNYASAHRVFPSGVFNEKGPISNLPDGYHFNWLVQILPFIQQPAVYRQFDFNRSVYDSANETARRHRIQTLLCPSDPWPGGTSYAACHHDVEAPIDAGNDGVFFLNSRIGHDDITDGLAHTIFLGEMGTTKTVISWAVGTRATLRNTGAPINANDPIAAAIPRNMLSRGFPLETSEIRSLVADGMVPPHAVGGFASFHPGGANFLLGDGSVRFLKDKIDQHVYQSLGHRGDGNLISDDSY